MAYTIIPPLPIITEAELAEKIERNRQAQRQAMLSAYWNGK